MYVFCDIYESTFPGGNEILYAPLHLHHQQHDSRAWCIINEGNTFLVVFYDCSTFTSQSMNYIEHFFQQNTLLL